MIPEELRAKPTLSIEEAARVLGIGRTLGYELARTGQLPGVLRLGSRYRISTAVLIRLLESQEPRDANP